MREKEARTGRRRSEPEPLETLTPDEYAGQGGPERPRPSLDEDLRPVPSQAEGDRETVEEDLRFTERRAERRRERRKRRGAGPNRAPGAGSERA